MNKSVAQIAVPFAARERPPAARILQRKCACGKLGGGTGECERCARKKESLQRHAKDTGPVEDIPAAVHEVLRSPGQPLDAASRDFMEARFGHDFSAVRVHTGDQAAASSEAVNALAYTVGNDMVFGAGQYAPATSQGRWLLAHELTHVVQQASGAAAMRKQSDGGGMGGDDLEREADAAADAIALAAGPEAEAADVLVAEAPRKKKPKGGAKEKPKKPADPCTRVIFAEGTCQFLVDNSAYRCCDPANGLSNPKRDVDIDKVDCPSHKFTPIFTCDNNCKTALSKGCDDNDNWMAVPRNQFTRSQCGDVWTICANGKSTTGYVRDQSVTKARFEVSPGIQKALGVPVGSSFNGAVYRPGAAQSAIDKDRCCKSAPAPGPAPAPSGSAAPPAEEEALA